MTHESSRHFVSRLWLYAFAGIVAVACAVPRARASGPVSVTDCNPNGDFSTPVDGRKPLRAFATDLGVYELDTTLKGVRIWQRTGDGTELQRPPNSDDFVPYTPTQLEAARQSGRAPFRFTGFVTEDGRIPEDGSNGIVFKTPVGLDKHPTENKFAVVSAGEYIDQGLNQYCPSIQVYGFEETAGEDGALASVTLTFEGSFENAFHETTNGWQRVIDRIWQYPDVLVTTNYFSDGSISSVTTNTFVEYETTLLDRSFSTNWVCVLSTNDGSFVTLVTNSYSRTGLEEPVWWNPLQTNLLVPDFEYTIIITNDWVSVSTNYYSLTNWVFKPVGITTNASYLAMATDVAFLGDAGLVASIVSEDYQAERSAFLVFGTDPAVPAKLFPVDDLDRAIRGIAVDKETGDIYAAVPDLSVVFRYQSPGRTPASWTTDIDDRTPVSHDDFAAGVTNAPGSSLGRLSHPTDVDVWYPDGGSPILLVADTSNNRIHAFDPTSLSWTETNWLGTACDASFVDDGMGFVVTTNTTVVRKWSGLQSYLVQIEVVSTNFYRLETTAFPLFATDSVGGVPVDSPMNPEGAWGQDGTAAFVLPDTGGHRVRVFSIDDLAALDSDEILAMAVWWPSVGGGANGLAARDIFLANGSSGGSVVYWDAAAPDAASTKVHVVREHETYANELHFTVAPARHDRTYTLSVSGGSGVVEPVQATATVPAGSTEGVFMFAAKDGIVSTETLVSWRDRYGNWVPEGDPSAAYAVTNTVSASPAYTLAVSSDGGFSTNALLAVENVDPIVTNAQVIGYVVPMDPPYVQALGFRIEASDASGADDSSLIYLWWASTNVNWAINHRDWAVTNNEWAASAAGEWSEGPSFPTEQSSTASVITGTEASGLVSNTVSLLVARGREVRLPPYPLGQDRLDEVGYPLTAEPGTTPFYIVCTVLDKDGGYAILSFPTASEPSDYADLWSGVYDRDVIPEGAQESTAVYAAEFIAVSGTNVTFVVRRLSGESDPTDTVTLQTSVTLDGVSDPESSNWSGLRQYRIGTATFPVTNNLAPAGSGPVRFYRVVRP